MQRASFLARITIETLGWVLRTDPLGVEPCIVGARRLRMTQPGQVAYNLGASRGGRPRLRVARRGVGTVGVAQ